MRKSEEPTLDRALLVKLLGMIGSAHDGEALAAARKADAIVKSAGMTWLDVVEGPDSQTRGAHRTAASAAPEAPPSPMREPPVNTFKMSDADVIDALLRSPRVTRRMKMTVEGYAMALKDGGLSRDDRAHLRNLYTYLKP